GRTLAKDDIAGACAIYPTDRGARCEPTPRGGFSADCPPSGDDGGGCSVPPRAPGGAGGALLFAAAAAIARLRRQGGGIRRAFGLAAALALALAFTGPACGGGDGSSSSSDTICDEGTVVFCRCADFSEGSKQCEAGGQSFGHCRSQATLEVCDDF